jgi:hypothetical protein
MNSIQEDIKERAYHKVKAKYEDAIHEVSAVDPYWSIDKERAEIFKQGQITEVSVYSYILTLIEKDNRL